HHPWVVGVGDNSSGPFCTGTVIDKHTVITAGHCFGGITRIFTGTDILSGPQTLTVVTELRHPGFSDSTLANDLTILKLGSAIAVQPSPMLRATMDNSGVYIGPSWTFTGYGDSQSSGGSTSGFGTKRTATFPIA